MPRFFGGEQEFPSRSELREQLGPILGDAVKAVGVNQGTDRFDTSSDIFENMSDAYYRPRDLVNPAKNQEVPDSLDSVAFTESDIPTSSSNYSRPRTIAAGYDEQRQTMTVVFRDGTFYNYYQVTPGEWQGFKASVSKGNPWLNKAGRRQGSDGLFLSKPRGLADVSSINPQIRELLYKVVRTSQIEQSSKLNRTREAQLRSKRRESALRGRETLRKTKGKNPATANRQAKPKKP
jgi:hypothetical protein